MQVRRTPRFERHLARLPVSVQKLFEEQVTRLQDHPADPRLHLKKLQGVSDAYSIRITRNYRALFVWDNDIILFYGVGDRKSIYRR